MIIDNKSDTLYLWSTSGCNSKPKREQLRHELTGSIKENVNCVYVILHDNNMQEV